MAAIASRRVPSLPGRAPPPACTEALPYTAAIKISRECNAAGTDRLDNAPLRIRGAALGTLRRAGRLGYPIARGMSTVALRQDGTRVVRL